MLPIVFKPKYQRRVYLSLIVLPLLAVIAVIAIWIDNLRDLTVIFFAGGCVVLTVLVALRLIRQFRFDANEIVIERHLYPSQTISYAEVVDFGTTTVKTRKSNIPVGAFANAGQLGAIFKNLLEQGVISSHQIEGKLIPEERRSAAAMAIAVLAAFVSYLLASWLGIWPRLGGIYDGLTPGVLVLILYCPTYWYLSLRTK
jgi:hypothetical protein